jgi:phosphoenolpyruvate carboxykinase (GTP)
MATGEAKARLGALFDGAMRGRTMYVVPYLLGPPGSPFSRVGVEITDSPYVVASMGIMTRMGKPALEALRGGADFVPGLHSLGDLDPARRFICHFPDERLVWSIGSGYGGNALLGKKCFALRIASVMARNEGWLAEHMLIIGIEDPAGRTAYIAAAFPSGCGKTNLSMLRPPSSYQGWKVWTVGDDIAWLRFDEEGTLRAVNPEAGFFGIAPGTSLSTNPNMMATIRRNTIFTNVGVAAERIPRWEGDGEPLPERAIDWQGKEWTPASGTPLAHPNSRFTAPIAQCPTFSARWSDPRGVPISAILFGGRRARLMPLIVESFDWRHGVFLAASLASETTAAATGQVGTVRRDPMAMLPFCGYHMGDYFAHWLEMGRDSRRLPRIFHANWFRKDASGRIIWPGYRENIRVLRWILERLRGEGSSVETPIGNVPDAAAIDAKGLELRPGALEDLLEVPREDWVREHAELGAFFEKLGDRLPDGMRREHDALRRRLG